MKIQIISLGLILFSVIIILLGIVKLHTYPGRIAVERNHPQTAAIKVTSLLGLLFFPLWILALIWAYSGAVLGSMYSQSQTEQIKEAIEAEDSVQAAAEK
jgi:uncharacterized membrane protein